MKRDELNSLHIKNTDGKLNVKENPLNDLQETIKIPEVKSMKDDVFHASEENSFKEEKEKQSFDNDNKSDNTSSNSSSSASASSAGAAVGAVGGVIGVIAVSAVLVLDIVKLPVIPAVDVHLISRSSSSLAFSLNTNIEDHSELYISLQGNDYEVSKPFQEYIKFSDLKENQEYTLAVYQNETSRYSSKYYTNFEQEINNITITVTSYIDDKLFFYFEDSAPGEKMYTVDVKNKAGTIIFTDETSVTKNYEIDNFKEDVAIFVSVNGDISAGVQVFKPIYDYEHIQWIWGEYGETVTAIIPSTNETDDYYIRDIRNFEIEREDATCTNDGFVIRQAAFIGPDKNRYENQKQFTLPALGHDFSDVFYTWSNDYHGCKAESICPECGTKIEESVLADVTEVVTDTKISYTKYTATFENENFTTRTHYEDFVYGSYPQTIVNDSNITNQLNSQYGTPVSQPGKWTAYDYFASGNKASFMYYVDVDLNDDGTNDYRGVYFDDYRPISTQNPLGISSYQYDNGYETDTTYWFSYDPISWDVLTQDDGKLLVSSNIVLDSQSFNHQMDSGSFTHNGGTGYANNYELSDIRNWLNNEFYSLAFDSGAEVISATTIDNSLASTLDSSNNYVCNDTNDKVFLLSRFEANKYLSNSQLKAIGSDYAKCQGLYVGMENDKAFWSLRTPYPNESYQIRYITNNGIAAYDSASKTSLGVRPACWINLD